MTNESVIKKLFPNSELGDIRPCTSAGRVQFHLLIDSRKEPTDKIVDVFKLAFLLKKSGWFNHIKESEELGVVKASRGDAEITVLASGRVVLMKVDGKDEAGKILEALAPLLKQAIF